MKWLISLSASAAGTLPAWTGRASGKGGFMNLSKRILPAFLAAAISLSIHTPAHAAEGEQQFANLGECKLESGEVIKDCRIGYRTRGTLNADKSNAVVVLLPMWDTSDSSNLVLFNEARWVDPQDHFVIIIDTLANKISIGPDNNKTQPGAKFPKASIRDMMEINRRVLKEALKLDKVYALFGEQLGGMQALQWMIAYPDEMQKVIAIAATPKADDWDVLAWQAQADIISRPRTSKQDDVWTARAAGSLNALTLAGPPYRINTIGYIAGGPHGILSIMQSFLLDYGLDRWGLYAQAIANHDSYRGYGNTAQKAIAGVKAKLLAMVLPDDQNTSTTSMLELAKLMNAKVVDLDKNEAETWIVEVNGSLIQKEVHAFLAK